MSQKTLSPPFNLTDTGPLTVAMKNIFLHVTKACNLRCAYCYFSASQPLPDEMTTAEFDRLWPEMVALRPQKVVFTGGEPLLHPDILELLGGLRAADPEHHVLRCLNTNGHLVTPELARALVGLADDDAAPVWQRGGCTTFPEHLIRHSATKFHGH